MAPNPFSEASPLKRTAEDASFDDFGPVKAKRRYHHHHNTLWRQEIDIEEPYCDDDRALNPQLIRCIALALEAVGFKDAESVALEKFSALAESYMAHFLASVRQSMLVSRRAQPTPQDFLHALTAHHLTLDSLLLHLDPPVAAAQTQPPLHAAAQTFTDSRATDAAIARLLQDGAPPAAALASHVPRCFPGLPSRHTYKAKAVYANRELDPKRIRERATEEGRLGEAALRRLVSGERANARQQPVPLSPTMARAPGQRELSIRQRTHDMWLETMEAVAKAYPRRAAGSRDVTPNPDAQETARSFSAGNIPQPVNADRQYWRKPPRQPSNQTGPREPGAGS